MEYYTVLLFIVGLIILLTALAERVKLSSPIFLIIAGIALSFVPGFKSVHIEPDIIFLLFLPPILYEAAIKIPHKDFREQFSTIATLAFGLVFLTTLGIGIISHYMIPEMTWSSAFLLGAILAATDAVAAISIIKNLGLSHKTNIILEGESLLNDASALVAFRFALAAVTGSTFVVWKAGLAFFFLIFGGVLTGILMTIVMIFLLRIVKNNSTAVNSFLLLAPFVTYLLAEEVKVSGVIAVVVLGFIISAKGEVHFSDKVKMQSGHIWEMIIFLLNGLIFILIGLELKEIIQDLDLSSLFTYSLYALVITVVAIAVRAWHILAHKKQLEKALSSSKMQNNRRKVSANKLISFQESVIISLSGMRGIVSLAIALALPETLEGGTPFPMRAPILFITFMVIFYSVVGQGLILPQVIRFIKKNN